jgi:hypothetical protein
VWKNRTTAFGLIPDVNHPGHAVMQVWENREVVRFVSWWPPGRVGKKEKLHSGFGNKSPRISLDAMTELGDTGRDILVKARKKGRSEEVAFEGQYLHKPEKELENWEGLKEEEGRWMQAPQNSVSLPGMGEQKVHWGLNLPAIVEWWDDWSQDAKYVMQSTNKNCAGAVAGALRAGGAECYVPAPIAWLVLPPNAITVWAQQLEDRLRVLEQRVKQLQHKAGHANLLEYRLPGEVLPTKDEWLKASAVARQPRSSELRAIDSALGEYHRFDTGAFNVNQHKRLVQLVEAIYTHVQTQPTSERNKWVLSLSSSALYALELANGRVNDVMPA